LFFRVLLMLSQHIYSVTIEQRSNLFKTSSSTDRRNRRPFKTELGPPEWFDKSVNIPWNNIRSHWRAITIISKANDTNLSVHPTNYVGKPWWHDIAFHGVSTGDNTSAEASSCSWDIPTDCKDGAAGAFWMFDISAHCTQAERINAQLIRAQIQGNVWESTAWNMAQCKRDDLVHAVELTFQIEPPQSYVIFYVLMGDFTSLIPQRNISLINDCRMYTILQF
jgi:hypothetical protein